MFLATAVESGAFCFYHDNIYEVSYGIFCCDISRVKHFFWRYLSSEVYFFSAFFFRLFFLRAGFVDMFCFFLAVLACCT